MKITEEFRLRLGKFDFRAKPLVVTIEAVQAPLKSVDGKLLAKRISIVNEANATWSMERSVLF